jgi:RNA polymerase sigma factor (TIGR02999 family)
LKLIRAAKIEADDRAHLLAIAARAMRQVLVDRARRRRAAKREDPGQELTLGEAAFAHGLDAEELLVLEDALDRLEPRQRRIVECRFFGGMNDKEIGAALGITDRTVRREWAKARAWLNLALYGPG